MSNIAHTTPTRKPLISTDTRTLAQVDADEARALHKAIVEQEALDRKRRNTLRRRRERQRRKFVMPPPNVSPVVNVDKSRLMSRR